MKVVLKMKLETPPSEEQSKAADSGLGCRQQNLGIRSSPGRMTASPRTVRGQEDILLQGLLTSTQKWEQMKSGPAPSSEAKRRGINPRPPLHLTPFKTKQMTTKGGEREGVSNAKHVVGLLAALHTGRAPGRGGETRAEVWQGAGPWQPESRRKTGRASSGSGLRTNPSPQLLSHLGKTTGENVNTLISSFPISWKTNEKREMAVECPKYQIYETFPLAFIFSLGCSLFGFQCPY